MQASRTLPHVFLKKLWLTWAKVIVNVEPSDRTNEDVIPIDNPNEDIHSLQYDEPISNLLHSNNAGVLKTKKGP
jgi:hypothetical protein